MALVKRHRAGMVSAHIVEILDLVDADDPVLARVRLLQSAELGSIGREAGSAHAVLGLAGGEERVEVVVGHFVPKSERGVCERRDWMGMGRGLATYMRELRMVGVASSSTRYSPRAVKKSRSFTSSGQMPSAILTIHRNLLISSPLYPSRPPKTTRT
jgi:hypothetical protein